MTFRTEEQLQGAISLIRRLDRGNLVPIYLNALDILGEPVKDQWTILDIIEACMRAEQRRT